MHCDFILGQFKIVNQFHSQKYIERSEVTLCLYYLLKIKKRSHLKLFQALDSHVLIDRILRNPFSIVPRDLIDL